MKNRFNIQASDFLWADNQFGIDKLFMTMHDLENRIYYEEKLRYFNKVLRRSLSEIEAYETNQYYSNYFLEAAFVLDRDAEIKRLKKKIEILNRLIWLGDKLMSFKDHQLHSKEFRLLESELISYSSFHDDLFLCRDYSYDLFYVPETKDELKNVRRLLRFALKKRLLSSKRDLRQSFRNIVKFLFKNMDDESAEYNVIKLGSLKTLFNSEIFHPYVRTENNKSVTWIT